MEFLKEELQVVERMVLDKMSQEQCFHEEKRNEKPSYLAHGEMTTDHICKICGKNDHVITSTKSGKRLIHYFSCERFVKMRPGERFQELNRKNLCFQCLYPCAQKNHEGVCFDQYVCRHVSHKKYNNGKHILVCEEHKDDPKTKSFLKNIKINL